MKLGYYIIVVAVLFVLLFISYYVFKSVNNLNFIQKIHNRFLRIIITIIILLIPLLFFSFINYMVIILHLFTFILLSNILIKIYNACFNKNKRKQKSNIVLNNKAVLIGLILTVIYLGIGVYLNYHVFETSYTIKTSKDIGQDNLKIIQISDSHIGTTFDGNGFKKQIEKLSKIEADIFVITGDFVDDSTTKEDMILSCEALSILKPKYGVYYVSGNHDRGYSNNRGFTYNELLDELKKNNVIVLEDEVKLINDKIYLVGRNDASMSRQTIDELTSNIDKTKYIIDLNHQPNDYDNEKKAGVDLVLSGHSHGGQLLFLGPFGVAIGANDEYYGLSTRGDTTYIVTSGISGWELDFKTGTKSEYVIINIVKE